MINSLKSMRKKNTTPKEYQEQEAIFRWAEKMQTRHPELAMLNGSLNGVRLSMGQRIKAKRSGMKAGIPDINLPVPKGKYHGLYIELKRKKGGKLSREQKLWLQSLSDYGYFACVCKGRKAAIEVIEKYIREKL